MATLLGYQAQFKQALANAPDFLKVEGFYVYKMENPIYDPEKDEYEGAETENVITTFLRGSKISEGVNRITFTTGSLDFTFGKPTVNGQLILDGEEWNILSISQDAIKLTYVFTVENLDGI